MPASPRFLLPCAVAAVAVLLTWPSTGYTAAPSQLPPAEQRILAQLDQLSSQLDRAHAALDGLEKKHPGTDVTRTAEAQEVSRILNVMAELRDKLEGLRRSRRLSTLQARSAQLETELKTLRDMGTPGLAAHPTLLEWRRVRARIAALSDKPAPPAQGEVVSSLDQVRLGSLHEDYKPSTARGLSIGLTLSAALVGTVMLGAGLDDDSGVSIAGAVVLGLSLAIGPSTGHMYASQPGRAWGLVAARMGAYSVAAFSIVGTLFLGGMQFMIPMQFMLPFVTAPFFGLAVALTIIDMVDAPRAARRANRRASGLQVSCVPAVLRTDTASVPGLVLSGRF